MNGVAAIQRLGVTPTWTGGVKLEDGSDGERKNAHDVVGHARRGCTTVSTVDVVLKAIEAGRRIALQQT